VGNSDYIQSTITPCVVRWKRHKYLITAATKTENERYSGSYVEIDKELSSKCREEIHSGGMSRIATDEIDEIHSCSK
jgi:hypothetical protein